MKRYSRKILRFTVKKTNAAQKHIVVVGPQVSSVSFKGSLDPEGLFITYKELKNP